MSPKTRVTVSLDRALVDEIDRTARASGRPRSRVIEEARRAWRRRRLEAEMREGYRALAEETRVAAEQWLPAGSEPAE